MPEDQNQNTQNTNPTNPQNQGYGADQNYQNNPYQQDPAYGAQSGAQSQPNQQYIDPNSQFDPQAAPAFDTNQGYSTDFGDPAVNQGFDPYTVPANDNVTNPTNGVQPQAAYDNNQFQPFGQDAGAAATATVPPLDEQFPNPNPTATPANTFEQKRTGSKIFLYGSIAVVVILLIAMGVLSYYNFFANKDTKNNTAVVDQTSSTNTTTDNTSKEDTTTTDNTDVVVDDGSTGGANTPASQARVNSDTQISKEWLIKSFTRPDVDATGNCLNLTVCGNQADPDNDGSTNIVEYNFGTDPLNADTDGDLIADGDELFVYFSNPKSKLSDSDNFNDGVEVTGCYDPTAASTAKMTNQKRSQIASNVTLRPLHEPTISLLKGAGATQSDIINRAVPLTACPAATTDTTTTSPTTNTTTTPSTTTTTTTPKTTTQAN